MSSRLYKIGTIFSRTEGLIRKKVLAENDKPLWYDVYAHFPPKYEPAYSRQTPKTEVREIFYEEDVVRAKIHKKFPKDLGLINLSSDTETETNSQKWIKSYNEYIAQGMSEDEALKKLKKFPEIRLSVKLQK